MQVCDTARVSRLIANRGMACSTARAARKKINDIPRNLSLFGRNAEGGA